MRFIISAILTVVTAVKVNGCSFSVGDTFQTTKGCNAESISAATGCTTAQLASALNSDADDVESYIAELCATSLTAEDTNSKGEYDPFYFSEVMGKGYIWDQNFFNGGTAYNGLEDTNTVADVSTRIQAVADTVATSSQIQFPTMLPNFQNCDAKTVMCCYVNKKQNDATNSEPVDSTDVCSHDIRTSRRAARVQAGQVLYGGDVEGNTQCHAFAFDEYDADGPYKGNTLFHMAMEQNFSTKHLTRAVPGAPMCACIEQMPVVSTATCTETAVTQDWIVADGPTLKLTNTEVEFSTCGDFKDYYETRFGNTDAIDTHLVGTCPKVPASFREKGYNIRDLNWIPLHGKGKFNYPQLSTSAARDLINGDGTNFKIVQRTCVDCVATHVKIFYKRLTPIPDDLDVMDLLLQNWFDVTGNEFNKDFKLYSYYQDAVLDVNAWTYCNFNYPNVGFPRDCGPEKYVGGQWNSQTHGGRVDIFWTVEA